MRRSGGEPVRRIRGRVRRDRGPARVALRGPAADRRLHRCADRWRPGGPRRPASGGAARRCRGDDPAVPRPDRSVRSGHHRRVDRIGDRRVAGVGGAAQRLQRRRPAGRRTGRRGPGNPGRCGWPVGCSRSARCPASPRLPRPRRSSGPSIRPCRPRPSWRSHSGACWTRQGSPTCSSGSSRSLLRPSSGRMIRRRERSRPWPRRAR